MKVSRRSERTRVKELKDLDLSYTLFLVIPYRRLLHAYRRLLLLHTNFFLAPKGSRHIRWTQEGLAMSQERSRVVLVELLSVIVVKSGSSIWLKVWIKMIPGKL